MKFIRTPQELIAYIPMLTVNGLRNAHTYCPRLSEDATVISDLRERIANQKTILQEQITTKAVVQIELPAQIIKQGRPFRSSKATIRAANRLKRQIENELDGRFSYPEKCWYVPGAKLPSAVRIFEAQGLSVYRHSLGLLADSIEILTFE